MKESLQQPTHEDVSKSYEASLPHQTPRKLGEVGIVGSHMASEAIALDYYGVTATTTTASEKRPITLHNPTKAFYYYREFNGETLSHNID